MTNDALPRKLVAGSAAGRLLLASFLSLFFELALIRWIPGTVHIVGFFTNLVLIASFLGLGVGMARPAPAADAVWRAFFRLAVVVSAFAILAIVEPTVVLPAGGDYGLNEISVKLLVSVPMPVILVVAFALVAWASIPLGRLVAGMFDSLDRVPAYTVNIGGSLLGVGAFSLLSLFHAPPAVWFGIGLALLGWLHPTRSLLAPGLVILVVLGALYVNDTHRFRSSVHWSPYYKVITRPVVEGAALDRGFVTDVNGQFLLSGFDLRPEASLPIGADPKTSADVERLKSYYDFPFELRPARRVLVLGAGAGNDVAAALRHDAEHITAVEIDRSILRLGERFHPEHPFDSPRVEVVIGDARSFLGRTHETYDLIVFATLDAHGLLSSAANVRLDSFVYTRESLEAAKGLLAPDGLLALSFGPFREDIQIRQHQMVTDVFVQQPRYFLHTNGHRTIVAGKLDAISLTRLPAEWRSISQDEVAEALGRHPYARVPATDDWPHLYIREHRVPTEYLWVFAGILALTILMVRRSFGRAGRFEGHFFFLGAGFLLLETKSVTEYALLIGATWQTNAMVFGVILAVICAANLLVLRWVRRPPLLLCYTGIFASLIAGYLWPIRTWGLAPGAASYALAAAYLGVPIFLAAVVFASTFRGAHLGSAALASNLLGAVLGGSLEYLSLAWGIRALSLIALGMYGASLAAWAWRGRRPDVVHPDEQRVIVLQGTEPAVGAAVRMEPAGG